MLASEKYVRLALDTVGVATFIVDENARIVFCNQAARSLLNCSLDEAVGSSFKDFSVQLVDENGAQIEDGEIFPLNINAGGYLDTSPFIFGLQLRGTEEMKWLQTTLQPLDNLGSRQQRITVTCCDVSPFVSEKKTIRQVHKAKSEWESTVDALQDIVTIQDRNMKILRANRVAHELFGYALGELKGKRCYEAFFNRVTPCDVCPVVSTGEDGCPHTDIIYNHTIDKTFSISSFPIFDQNGRMHQLVHVARDITQHLLNESEKNRLTAAIEQTSESVVISGTSGTIQYVNPAFEHATGYSRQEALGKKMSILKSGVHDEAFYADMWKTLLGKQVWRGRLVNKRKNGTLFKEDATISPVLDSTGRIINYVALKRDVTREEQLEQQLHQAMKMEALGTLAGGIAHDFNNILSAMIGYGEIARSRLDRDHPAHKDIDQVLASGDRAVDLVKQILTFSRKESYGQFRLFKLQYIIKEIIKLLRPSLPATIELVHMVDSSCRSILADPGQIYQVVMNLCTNARQSIGTNHGKITLGLTEISADGVAVQAETGEEPGAYLKLEVSDTGCGIKEDHLGRIFDPFFTTKKKEQGTGLGLAVVHGIIKKHKGEIHVTSTVGSGTTFHVYLAVDGREEKQRDQEKNIELAGNERIMVIDDEKEIARMLQIILERSGYKVSRFVSAIDAVRQFRRDPHCCDLVITDMLMPDMTGAELSREFIFQRPDIPIIMLTGHSENIDRKRAGQLGVKELLLKPVKEKQLYETIRRVLNDGKNIDH